MYKSLSEPSLLAGIWYLVAGAVLLVLFMVMGNCARSKTPPFMAQFLIPKTARSNTSTFKLGISAVFVIVVKEYEVWK